MKAFRWKWVSNYFFFAFLNFVESYSFYFMRQLKIQFSFVSIYCLSKNWLFFENSRQKCGNFWASDFFFVHHVSRDTGFTTVIQFFVWYSTVVLYHTIIVVHYSTTVFTRCNHTNANAQNAFLNLASWWWSKISWTRWYFHYFSVPSKWFYDTVLN